MRRAPSSSSVLGNTNGERAVQRLKGYFGLAKDEIDKAVRADEQGTFSEALQHYRNADRILSEGISAHATVESSRLTILHQPVSCLIINTLTSCICEL